MNKNGSVGKSSVAKSVQAQGRGVRLHVPKDVFLGVLPEALKDQGRCFADGRGAAGAAMRVGPIGDALGAVMFDAVTALAGRAPAFESLTAPLAVLETPRDGTRGQFGLAHVQTGCMHQRVADDLRIDCATRPVQAVAALICKELDV